MIVRDDERVVERCLRSAGDLIDYWVICDTGSLDATPEIVKDVLADIPGELHSREWLDSGHNRSHLMELALDRADYLLLLDPDMTLVQRRPLPLLEEDAYLVREIGDPGIGAPRVVRGSRRWWFEGSTHEVLASNGRFSEGELDALAVERHTDPSAHRLKLLGDLGILKRDIASGRWTPKTALCLAETLRALDRPWPAIEWYRRRVELGGSEQEVFYANLQEGALRASVAFESAVPVLLEAWRRRPTRAEPLYELARAYQARDDATVAHLFADQGLAIPYPADTAFVQPWVYEWGLRLVRGWAGARLGRSDEAREDLRAVLAAPWVPREVVATTRDWLIELTVHDHKVARPADAGVRPPLGSLVPGMRLGEIKLDLKPAWPAFNPSIASDGPGFSMIVRSANYRVDFGAAHDDGIVRNINYLVRLNAMLGLSAVDPIDDGPEDLRRYPSAVLGFEDCRLVRVAGRWFACATTAELNPIERSEMVLMALDGPEVTSVLPLAGPKPGRAEKNWMPFVHDGELHFVYSCAPMIVLRCDHRTGRLTMASETRSPELASSLRGGSQGLALERDGGYLFIVHGLDRTGGKAIYSHRFIRIDPELRLSAISRPFTFTGERIEFCSGAAIQGSDLVVSFGVGDAAAFLAIMPLVDTLDLLEPVPAS